MDVNNWLLVNAAEQAATEAEREACAYLTLRVPSDVIDAINRARETAMKHTLVARIPECGVFAEIAQDLDYVQSKLVPGTKT